MTWNVKLPECLDCHAICSGCFFMNNSYKCTYCRRMGEFIEIRNGGRTIVITNNVSSHIVLYYALKGVCENNNNTLDTALKYLDPDNRFSYVKQIISPEYRQIILSYTGCYIIMGMFWNILNNIGILALYCNEFGCYLANFYWLYLFIKMYILTGIVLSWGYLFYKYYYSRQGIKYNLFHNLKNEHLNKIRNV